MTNPTASRATVPAMPTRRKPQTILTPKDWAEVHDALTLALDALGDGPEDVDQAFLLNCVANQRIGLRITHAQMQKLEKVMQ